VGVVADAFAAEHCFGGSASAVYCPLPFAEHRNNRRTATVSDDVQTDRFAALLIAFRGSLCDCRYNATLQASRKLARFRVHLRRPRRDQGKPVSGGRPAGITVTGLDDAIAEGSRGRDSQQSQSSAQRFVGGQASDRFVGFFLSAPIVLFADELLDRNPGSLR
jgi:hypothetical protein